MDKQKQAAVVFPGQGSQRPGMGRDFHDELEPGRLAYQEASDALGWDVGAMCFGDDERLNLTQFAQPCILATEIAMLRGIESRFGFCPGIFGGHSLGEYTALVAAGVIPFSDALKIVSERGRLMQEAVPKGQGAMCAVIRENLEPDFLFRAIRGLAMDVANINSTGQVVISGEARVMDQACQQIRQALEPENSIRFVPLNVSAPFHSRFMQPVAELFGKVLEKMSSHWTHERAALVVSNFTGGFHVKNRALIQDALVLQIHSPVLWQDNMRAIAGSADKIFEVGPARPLSGFFKKSGVRVTSITSMKSAHRAFERD